MPRFKLLIEYDGTHYFGWQRQNSNPTIQSELERALATATGNSVSVVGSGRTDAGVHARGQVAHFDAVHDVDTAKLFASLNGLLPKDIVVLEVAEVDRDFHARYDATARLYKYYVATRPTAMDRLVRKTVPGGTDFDAMNACAHEFVGTHDFSSFCRTQSATTNRVCTVTRAAWVRESRPSNYFFAIESDRFLHGMVRAIVGTLLEVGRGKRRSDSLTGILASKDRRAAGEAAAARGLVLEEVTYPAPRNYAPGS